MPRGIKGSGKAAKKPVIEDIETPKDSATWPKRPLPKLMDMDLSEALAISQNPIEAYREEIKDEIIADEPKEKVKEKTNIPEGYSDLVHREKGKEPATGCRPPHLKKCQCQDKLSSGQAYFEDGETGTHIVGEDTKNEIWFREGNGGKGSWANKKR